MNVAVESHFRITGLCAAIAGALLLMPAAHAQSLDGAGGAAEVKTDSAQSAAVTLDSVSVSAQRLEESVPLELAKYGNRLQVIDAEEISRRGFVDVAQALQQLAPAITLVRASGAFGGAYVSMEGSRPSEILWLIDGVRVNNRLYAGTSPLDMIPSAMIERIEVLEGGQGLFYGTQAVAGVVNVITKSTLEKGTDGQLSIGLDSHDGRHISGNVRTAIGPHQLVVYASNDEAKGFKPFHPDDYQPSETKRDRSYDVTMVGAKYAINADRLRVSAGYQRTSAKLDLHTPNLTRAYYNDRTEDLANVKLDWEASDTFGFYVKGYYHNWDSYINRINNVVGSPGASVVYRDRVFWGYEDYGLNAMAKFAPGNGVEYFLGYDYQTYSGKDESLAIAEQEEKVHAAIAQVRTMDVLVDGLAMSAGFRYNKPTYGDAATIWNMSGQYNITHDLFVRATGGTSYRLPDAGELFAIDACCTIGNPSLTAEESRNLNVSVGGYFDLAQRSASWEVVGFTREVENLIATVVDPATGIPTFQNGSGVTKVNGFLATTTLPLTESLTATASYSQTDAKRSGVPIDRIPDSSTKLILDLAPPESRFGGSLIASRLGEIAQTTSLGRQTYGNFWEMDVSAYVQFGEGDKQRISARVENLTDKQYIANLVLTTPDDGGSRYLARNLGAPRTFYLTYSYDF